MHAEPAPQKSTTVRFRPLPVPGWVRVGVRLTSAVAPAWGSRLTRQLFFRPPRLKPRPEERAVLKDGERFSFEGRDGLVAGWTWGAGPTVLLVHGWGGHAGQLTGLVAPLRRAGCRVVAVDLPGHGDSEGTLSSLVHFTDALEHAATLFGPLQGTIAHSFGAASVTLGLSRGLPLGRAVFLAPPLRFDSFWERFQASVGVPAAVFERTLREAEAWLQVRFQDIQPQALAPQLTAPLLVLHARDDREVACDEGIALAQAWPGAQLRTLEGLGHVRMLRDSGVLEEAAAFMSPSRRGAGP